jgi:hypothetical protein
MKSQSPKKMLGSRSRIVMEALTKLTEVAVGFCKVYRCGIVA